MQEVADYLANFAPQEQAEYERLKTIVISMVPNAEETMSYGIPTFKYKHRPLIHFGIFKEHMSLFPGAMSPEIQAKITSFRISKGTIQYTVGHLIPEDIIRELITHNLEKINS